MSCVLMRRKYGLRLSCAHGLIRLHFFRRGVIVMANSESADRGENEKSPDAMGFFGRDWTRTTTSSSRTTRYQLRHIPIPFW